MGYPSRENPQALQLLGMLDLDVQHSFLILRPPAVGYVADDGQEPWLPVVEDQGDVQFHRDIGAVRLPQ